MGAFYAEAPYKQKSCGDIQMSDRRHGRDGLYMYSPEARQAFLISFHLRQTTTHDNNTESRSDRPVQTLKRFLDDCSEVEVIQFGQKDPGKLPNLHLGF